MNFFLNLFLKKVADLKATGETQTRLIDRLY